MIARNVIHPAHRLRQTNKWTRSLGHLVFVVAAVLAVSGVQVSAVAESRPKKNVLFIVADDLNDHLGCYGHPVKTPAIDELARRGMRFDRAYCQVPVCNPSRVSFLSGLRPDHTRVFTLLEPTRSHLGDWAMLPEYFRQHGYFAAGVGKIYHTDVGFEDPRSWDVEIREFGKRPPFDQIIKSANPDGPGEHTTDWAWLKTADEQTPDGMVARKAVELLKQSAKGDKPFFLGVGFRRPHAPYAAPQKYFEYYPPAEIRLPATPPAGHAESLLPAALNFPLPAKPLPEAQQRELIAAYYACTSFVDAQVALLLKALDELKLWDNTIVVFIGDHGYHLGEHGGLWHKMSLFEESLRVPLIIYSPEHAASGRNCAQLVELIDLYPTLVAECDLPHRDGLDGADLNPLLDDPTLPVKQAAYSLTTRDDRPEHNNEKFMSYQGRSVRTARWRYTEWDGGRRGTELYDHDSDSHEWRNLAADAAYADTIAEMKRHLAQENAPHDSP